jgi:hypothetical protein
MPEVMSRQGAAFLWGVNLSNCRYGYDLGKSTVLDAVLNVKWGMKNYRRVFFSQGAYFTFNRESIEEAIFTRGDLT